MTLLREGTKRVGSELYTGVAIIYQGHRGAVVDTVRREWTIQMTRGHDVHESGEFHL